MYAIAKMTRGRLGGYSLATTLMTVGFIVIPVGRALVPEDFIPTFIIPAQGVPFGDIYNNVFPGGAPVPEIVLVGRREPLLSTPAATGLFAKASPNMPVLTTPDIFDKEADIYNKEDAPIYNKEQPELIDDPEK